MKKLILFALLGFCFTTSNSQIIHIPGDYPTIQQGVDAALNGDTILVDTGTYVENINIFGKNVTLTSRYLTTLDTAYISQTIIYGDHTESVVTCWAGSDPSAMIICGFTITNGADWGGMYLAGELPVINHVTFIENAGSGLFVEMSDPLIINCKFINNEYSGIGMHHGHVVVKNSIFNGNQTGISQGCFGAELSIVNSLFINQEEEAISGNYTYLHISNATFANNSSPEYEFAVSGSSGIITNSIFWNNSQYEISGSPTITYSDIRAGWTGEGNINEYPAFVNTGANPYQLGSASICIDAGTPDTTGLNLPDEDILGNLRIWDGNGDGIATIDMGAYEYVSSVHVPETEISKPDIFVLSYPNPFSTFTTIEYRLYQPETVKLTFYDQSGTQVVKTEESQAKGLHQFIWTPAHLPKGAYYFRIQAGEQMASGQVVKMN